MKNKRRYCLLGTVLVFLVLISACSNGSVSVDPSVSWPDDIEMYYGQILSDRQIHLYPNKGTLGVFAWARPNDSVGQPGLNSHTVIFTPDDTANYKTLSRNINIRVKLNVEMAGISGSSFTMGSPAEEASRNSDETQWPVKLSAFRMGKYEVTQEQYEAVMKTNPSRFTGNSFPPAAGEDAVKRPVEQVSWYEAIVFCNRLSIAEGLTPAYRINNSTDPAAWGSVPESGNVTWNGVAIVSGSNGYRLPTEAQWEYACRAGTTTAYNTGDTMSDSTGWYSGNSGQKTHEVGKTPPNTWGLYDMHGNVWEWCWDWYGTYPGGPQTDPEGAPTGSSSNRVYRGGSWLHSDSDARSACRSKLGPSSRQMYIGFRLVRPYSS